MSNRENMGHFDAVWGLKAKDEEDLKDTKSR